MAKGKIQIICHLKSDHDLKVDMRPGSPLDKLIATRIIGWTLRGAKSERLPSPQGLLVTHIFDWTPGVDLIQ
jgi:hypothetical protein